MEWGLSQASDGHAHPAEPHVEQLSFKVLADPVHRTEKIPDVVRQVLDTQQLQRLRDLKQLGTCYYVFPGASHNRFEHSLGVSHLSGESLQYLYQVLPASSQMRARGTDIEKCVRIAGLVHDLGHGPFSHVFDGQFIPTVLPGSEWCHEDMSERMLEHLLDSNGITVLDDEVEGLPGYTGREAVQAMVQGRKPRGLLWDDGRADFLFEIVANKATGIDTDKWDYLYRDAHSLALPPGFDFNRILYSQRVVNGRIAYHAGNVQDIYEMFHMRYTMFNKIYLHRATRSIELMLCDVLKLADSAFAPGHAQHRWLSGAIHEPAKYARLSDNRVLGRIEDFDDPTNVGMRDAQALLNRLYKRKLYRFVDEQLLPVDLTMRADIVLTPEALAEFNPDPGLDLRPEDIGVHDLKLDYGKKDQNPVDSCPFYRSPWDTTHCLIKGSSVSHVGIPAHFRERKLRVYSRRAEERYVNAILVCFARWCRKHGIPHARAHPSSKAQAVEQPLADAHDTAMEAAGAASEAAALHASGRVLTGEEVYRPRAVDDYDFHNDDVGEQGEEEEDAGLGRGADRGAAAAAGRGVAARRGTAAHLGSSSSSSSSAAAAAAPTRMGAQLRPSGSAQSLQRLGSQPSPQRARQPASEPQSLVPPYPVSRGASTTPARHAPPPRAHPTPARGLGGGGGGGGGADWGSQPGASRAPRLPQHPAPAAAPGSTSTSDPSAGDAMLHRSVSASTSYTTAEGGGSSQQRGGALLGIDEERGGEEEEEGEEGEGGVELPEPVLPARSRPLAAAGGGGGAVPSAGAVAFSIAAAAAAEQVTREHAGGVAAPAPGAKRDIRAFFSSSGGSQPAAGGAAAGSSSSGGSGSGAPAEAKRSRTGLPTGGGW